MSVARSLFASIALGLLLAQSAAAQIPTGRIDVFAAASMTEAVEALAAAFGQASGKAVRTSYASSSTLARQIEAGAPADVYISANRRWMTYLKERNHVDAQSVRPFAGNRLVVIVPAGHRLDTLDGLVGLRVALGDPDHVPAGAYARRFLERVGLWPRLAAHIARAKDVRAALALVARGEADASIVYRTDARISDQVTVAYEAAADPQLPIVYEIAVVAEADAPLAEAFIDFALGAEGQAILTGFGFIGVADLEAPGQ